MLVFFWLGLTAMVVSSFSLSGIVSTRRLARFRTAFAQVHMTSSTASTIDTTLLKKLREISSAPMMDCKNALQSPEVAGDIEKAVAWLRAKGLAKITKSTRSTKEGLIGLHVSEDNSSVVLVEVNCETDFVKRNKDFQHFVALLAESVSHTNTKITRDLSLPEILALKPSSNHATVEEALADVASSIRETIAIRRASIIAAPSASTAIYFYVHNKVSSLSKFPAIQLGKIASLVSLKMSSVPLPNSEAVQLLQDTGRKLAMHVAAAQPLFLDAANASTEFVEAETAIFQELVKQDETIKQRSDDVLKRIVEGKVKKRVAEVSLLQQSHQVEENNPVISKFLEELSKKLNLQISIDSYAWWSLNQ